MSTSNNIDDNIRDDNDHLSRDDQAYISFDETIPLLSTSQSVNNPSGLPWYRTPSPYWILVGFVLISLTWGIIIVTRVQIYMKIICQLYYESKDGDSIFNFFFETPNELSSDPLCNIPEVHAITSQLILLLNLCAGLPAIFVLGALGSLSDRRGRRIVIMIASAGIAFDILILVIVAEYLHHVGIYLIFLGPLVEGFSGSIMGFVASSQAYVADCTNPDKRNVVFGWLQAAFFLGITIGPSIGGLIVEATDNLLSVLYIALVVFALFPLAVYLIPESTSSEQRIAYTQQSRVSEDERSFWHRYNIFAPLSILLPKKKPATISNNGDESEPSPSSYDGKNMIFYLAVINALLIASIWGIQSVLVLYTTLKFDWGVLELGYFLLFCGGLRVLVLAVGLPILVKYFSKDDKKGKDKGVDSLESTMGNSANTIIVTEDDGRGNLVFDLWIIRIGLIIDAVAYFALGFVSDGLTFTFTLGIGALGSIVPSTIKSLITNLVPPSQIGQLLGALSVLESLMRIVSPTFFNALYSIVVASAPGMVWCVVGGLLGIAGGIAFGIGPKYRWR